MKPCLRLDREITRLLRPPHNEIQPVISRYLFFQGKNLIIFEQPAALGAGALRLIAGSEAVIARFKLDNHRVRFEPNYFYSV